MHWLPTFPRWSPGSEDAVRLGYSKLFQFQRLLTYITTRSRNWHVSAVSSEPKRFLRKSKVATADSMPNNESNFVAQSVRIRHFDYLQQDNLAVLPEDAVCHHMKDKQQKDGIDKAVDMSENK